MAKKPARGKKTTKMAKKKAGATKKSAAPATKTVIKYGYERSQKTRTATRPKNTGTLSYTMSEFLDNVKGFCGLAKRSEAKEMCEDLATLIKDSLRKGYKIPLFGLGKMYVRHSKARTGRNPQTGEPVQIPARKRVRFTALRALKEAVL